MAWKTDERYRDQIDIRLDNGVYCLPATSAIGKTVLAKWLHTLHLSHSEPVNSIRSYEGLMAKELDSYIPKDCKVFMLDDYDLYNGKFADTIYDLGKRAIVLIDCKMPPEFSFDVQRCNLRYDRCDLIIVDQEDGLEFTPNGSEVTWIIRRLVGGQFKSQGNTGA